MAFGRLERSGRQQPMSDINMTPLIDVMLVLLVVFMLTAPLMSSSLKLDLPQSDAAQASSPDERLLDVALAADGRYYWGEEPVSREELQRRIGQAAERGTDREVQIRADRQVSYGQIAELLGWLQGSGFTRIAFVAEPGAAADPAGNAIPPGAAGARP